MAFSSNVPVLSTTDVIDCLQTIWNDIIPLCIPKIFEHISLVPKEVPLSDIHYSLLTFLYMDQSDEGSTKNMG